MYRFTLMMVSSGFLGLMSATIGCDADSEDSNGASCRSDLDCKGDRVCDRGMCVALDDAADDDEADDEDEADDDGNAPGPSADGKLPSGDDGGPTSDDDDDDAEPPPSGTTGPATDDDDGGGENSWYYGDPAGGCIAAEYEVSFSDVDAGVCAPVCSNSGLCPPNLDGSATPFCFEDDWLCYLVCEVADPNACPAGATCWDAGEGLGLCLYGN